MNKVILSVFVGIHLALSTPVYKTCLEAKEKGETVNRTFLMRDDHGMTFDVYCEFGLHIGYSFISNTILSNNGVNISNIIPNDTTSVSLRMMYSNGTQAETLIEQLPENDKIPLGIFMSGNQNYQSSHACSFPHMMRSPNYLYIGMLSSNDMQHHARGYQANGKSYRATGNEPNHACYFAIFFNSQCVNKVNNKPILKNSTMNGWYESAKPLYDFELPSDLFFKEYIVSCLGSQDFVTYNSYDNTEIAIGLPFGRKSTVTDTTVKMFKDKTVMGKPATTTTVVYNGITSNVNCAVLCLTDMACYGFAVSPTERACHLHQTTSEHISNKIVGGVRSSYFLLEP